MPTWFRDVKEGPEHRSVRHHDGGIRGMGLAIRPVCRLSPQDILWNMPRAPRERASERERTEVMIQGGGGKRMESACLIRAGCRHLPLAARSGETAFGR